MSGFSADWLALREPADHVARSPELTRRLADWARQRGRLRILDLGSGTGSNLRYLAPRLGVDQEWCLLDHDAELLARLPRVLLEWASANGHSADLGPDRVRLLIHETNVDVSWTQTDLSAIAGDERLPEADLVTASALLDLVSLDWTQALARLCRERECAALLALTYDGRVEWVPGLLGDAEVRALLNAHQRRDKGLGMALGPDGATAAAACFAEVGRSAILADSDWRLGAETRALQEALARGWAEAAIEIDPGAQGWIAPWLAERLALVGAGQSRLIVGHQDLLSLPSEP